MKQYTEAEAAPAVQEIQTMTTKSTMKNRTNEWIWSIGYGSQIEQLKHTQSQSPQQYEGKWKNHQNRRENIENAEKTNEKNDIGSRDIDAPWNCLQLLVYGSNWNRAKMRLK